MFGLYLHVPYCVERCTYCNFFLTTQRRSLPDFLNALDAELRRVLPRLEAARDKNPDGYTVALGGGTPSLLPAEWLRELLQLLQHRLGAATEVALEANPEDVTAGSAAAWRSAGVDRLTIGVQSLNDAVLKSMGRIHDSAAARTAVATAQTAGFENLGIDLMFGLPSQTPAAARSDLQVAADWPVTHISHYALEVDGATPLGLAVQRKRLAGWEEAEEADFYAAAKEVLAVAGFNRYEVSNYARPGFESRHNSLYWTDADYLGLGPSAASYWDGSRQQEPANLETWMAAAGQGGIERGDWRGTGPAEALRDALAMGLRLTRGVDLPQLWRKYSPAAVMPKPELILADLLEQNLIIWQAPHLMIAPDRQFLTEGIIGGIVARLGL